MFEISNWFSERSTENTESNYFEENASHHEDFCPIILPTFQFEPKLKKAFGNENLKKEIKHIQASDANLVHLRVGILDWCKCRHCKNKVRKIDCLCCREVDTMLISLSKNLEREGSIS